MDIIMIFPLWFYVNDLYYNWTIIIDIIIMIILTIVNLNY